MRNADVSTNADASYIESRMYLHHRIYNTSGMETYLLQTPLENAMTEGSYITYTQHYYIGWHSSIIYMKSISAGTVFILSPACSTGHAYRQTPTFLQFSSLIASYIICEAYCRSSRNNGRSDKHRLRCYTRCSRSDTDFPQTSVDFIVEIS